MKIEIEHEGSCLGATGGTGRLIVRDALAKGHSVVALVRSKARALITAMTRSGVRRLVCISVLGGLLRNGRRGGVEISRNHVGKNGARLC